MPAPDIDERSALFLSGLLTDEEAAACEREIKAGSAEEREAFARMNDAAALVTMALTPRHKAPAAARAAVMAAAGIPAAPAAEAEAATVNPEVEKFAYLMNDEGWNEPVLPGIRVKPLFTNPKGGHRIFLLELQPGTHLPEHPHAGYEECLILRGDLVNEGRKLGVGDYVRATPSTQHLEVYTEEGCLCVIIASAA